jgi:hypothetical protein
MRLGPDELTISKLDYMELIELTGTTRSNQDLVRFPLSNPHKGQGNTNFLGSTTTLVTPGQPSPSRGTNPQE